MFLRGVPSGAEGEGTRTILCPLARRRRGLYLHLGRRRWRSGHERNINCGFVGGFGAVYSFGGYVLAFGEASTLLSAVVGP